MLPLQLGWNLGGCHITLQLLPGSTLFYLNDTLIVDSVLDHTTNQDGMKHLEVQTTAQLDSCHKCSVGATISTLAAAHTVAFEIMAELASSNAEQGML